MSRAIGGLIALVLPPLGVLIAAGPRLQFLLSLLLVAGAALVFLLLYAGPGVVLYGVGIVHALAVALFSRQRSVHAA